MANRVAAIFAKVTRMTKAEASPPATALPCLPGTPSPAIKRRSPLSLAAIPAWFTAYAGGSWTRKPTPKMPARLSF